MAGQPPTVRNEDMERLAAQKAEELTRATDEQIAKLNAKVPSPDKVPVPGERVLDDSGQPVSAAKPGEPAAPASAPAPQEQVDYVAQAKKAAEGVSIPATPPPGVTPQKPKPETTDIGQAIKSVAEVFKEANAPVLARIEELERQRTSDTADYSDTSDNSDMREWRKRDAARDAEIATLKQEMADHKRLYEEQSNRLIMAERRRFEQAEKQQIKELANVISGQFPKDSNGRPLVVAGQLKDTFYDWAEAHPEMVDYDKTPSLAAVARERMPELAQEIFEPLAELAARVTPAAATTTVVAPTTPAPTETGPPATPPPSVPSAPTAAPHVAAPEEDDIDIATPDGINKFFDAYQKKYIGVAQQQAEQRR